MRGALCAVAVRSQTRARGIDQASRDDGVLAWKTSGRRYRDVEASVLIRVIVHVPGAEGMKDAGARLAHLPNKKRSEQMT
jgi:hypothetical protein